MKFINWLSLLVICASLLSFVGCKGSGAPSESDKAKYLISIATAPASGVYLPIGSAFSRVFENKGYKSSILETAGTAENLELIKKGDAKMAIVMNDTLIQAYKGVGSYSDKGAYANFRVLMSLYPNIVQVISTEKSRITSFTDLRGKKVAVGAKNSGVEQNAQIILKAYGMDYKNIDEVYLDYGSAAEQIKKGNIDAAFVTSGAPNATISNLANETKIVVVPISGDGRVNLLQTHSFFKPAKIYKGTYGNGSDIETVAIMNVMLVSKNLPYSIVYDLMDAVYENIDAIKESHPVAKRYIGLDLVSDLPVPLHPGARKFYEDKEILKK